MIPKKFEYEKNGWCYNWTKTVSESDIFVLKQELDFGKYQKEHIPYEIYLKYKNTLDFYNFLSIELAGKIIDFFGHRYHSTIMIYKKYSISSKIYKNTKI